MSTSRVASMLVVDDDPRSRKLLEGYLLAEGYRVRSADDGPSALEQVRADPPDVILLDVMMPVMTGYEVCRRIKSDEQSRQCQVMLVTALDSTPDQVEGLDTGADDYLAKPVRREEFLAKVRALVRARAMLGELEQARQELAARNQELQMKKTLAQSLVHDLKSPLSAILGNLDLLEMRGDAELLPLVRRSREGARRMLKMILNLLDVEALEEGQLNPTLDRVDVQALVRATIEEAHVSAEQKQIELAIDSTGTAWAEADPILLRRVLDNLVSNAIAHTPQGGRIVAAARLRDEGIELVIEDSGPGIPEAMVEAIFEKYARVDRKNTPRASNRGLGLTFCKLAVEAQGGTIWAENREEGGARFRAVMPAAAETGQPVRVDSLRARSGS